MATTPSRNAGRQETTLLHQSRAANKGLGRGHATSPQFRSPRSRAAAASRADCGRGEAAQSRCTDRRRVTSCDYASPIVASSRFDQRAGVGHAGEPVRVQAFVAQAPVERFHTVVFVWLAAELAHLVRPNHLRQSALMFQSIRNARGISTQHRPIPIHRHRFVRAIIDHGEAFQTAALGQAFSVSSSRSRLASDTDIPPNRDFHRSQLVSKNPYFLHRSFTPIPASPTRRKELVCSSV